MCVQLRILILTSLGLHVVVTLADKHASRMTNCVTGALLTSKHSSHYGQWLQIVDWNGHKDCWIASVSQGEVETPLLEFVQTITEDSTTVKLLWANNSSSSPIDVGQLELAATSDWMAASEQVRPLV